MLGVGFPFLALRLGGASQAQRRRIATVPSIGESVRVICPWGLTMTAFFACGLDPFCRANMRSHCARDVEGDPELREAHAIPDRLTTSSRNLT